MLPTLFEIGPFTIYSLWLMVVIGFVVSTMLFLKKAKYERMEVNFLLDHSLSLLLGAMFISRLVFFLTNWGYFGPLNLGVILKQVFFFWQPGYSFWGALLGFGLVFIWHCRREKENPMKWVEIASIPFFVGLIFGHFGQFLDGQAYGKETILPWGIVFESTNVKYTVPIHPTQIYILLVVIAILTTRKRIIHKWPFFGQKYNWTLFAVAMYSFARFWIEFLRGDDTLQFGPFRIAQIVAIVLFVHITYILYKRSK